MLPAVARWEIHGYDDSADARLRLRYPS